MTIVRTLAVRLCLPVVVVVLWWVLSAGSQSFYYPPLSTIVHTLGKVWLHGDRIKSDVLPSIARLLIGYVIAAVVGIAVGVVVGTVRWLRIAVEPVLEFLRAVPPPVMAPVLLLVVGIGSTTKVAIIATGCVWPILLNTVQGVRSVDPIQTETARCYGIHGAARLRQVLLPAAAPRISAGLRQSLSIAIILMVISEMMASTGGIGYQIVRFQRTFAIPEMWSGIIVLGILGIVLSALYRVAERRVLSWYFGMRKLERGEA